MTAATFLAGMFAGACALVGALVILAAIAAWTWIKAGEQARQEADAVDLSADLIDEMWSDTDLQPERTA
jgi:hypothetical protein